MSEDRPATLLDHANVHLVQSKYIRERIDGVHSHRDDPNVSLLYTLAFTHEMAAKEYMRLAGYDEKGNNIKEQELLNVDWTLEYKEHEWQFYVRPDIRDAWKTLSSSDRQELHDNYLIIAGMVEKHGR